MSKRELAAFRTFSFMASLKNIPVFIAGAGEIIGFWH
jgi:hypothetical protein